MTLFSLVETYAALGDHRTGTSVDDATVTWFADELRTRGADVELLPYTFDRYDAHWEVRSGGRVVESLPLFYEGVGAVTSDAPTVGSVPAMSLLIGQPVYEPFLSGDVAVVATEGERLVVPNRAPKAPGDIPVVLVAGDTDLGDVTVEIEARVIRGRSSNVVARFGDRSDAPIVIATPLSGWFACASERGTGVAIALELGTYLGQRTNVVVIGTTGHELIDLGLKRLLERGHPPARAVLHLGANVAGAGDDGAFSLTRICNVAFPDDVNDGVTNALQRIDLTPNHIPIAQMREPARWVGEAKEWCALGVPLLSIAGHNPWFHTPQDLPNVSTSPELLDRALHALTDVGDLLCEGVRA